MTNDPVLAIYALLLKRLDKLQTECRDEADRIRFNLTPLPDELVAEIDAECRELGL
jgi:hypothetical protein